MRGDRLEVVFLFHNYIKEIKKKDFLSQLHTTLTKTFKISSLQEF